MTDAAPIGRTIFLALAGSHAHGTARDGSDVDLRGVSVAPLRARVSFRGMAEQAEGPLAPSLWRQVLPNLEAHPTAARGLGTKVETTVYDVAKFVRLCADANPNALEILFADEADWVHETPVWRRLHAERRRFLSRKVQQTYLGYAMAQLKRIRTHRAWLLDPPARKPERADFGLPEQGTLSREDRDRIEIAIAERLRGWGLDDVEMPKAARVALRERLVSFQRDVLAAGEDEAEERARAVAGRALGLTPELIAALTAERRYRAALRHWESYQTWKEQRNPARADLEARFGYDTKHGMHLVRLMRTGLELLETGELRVRRADADGLVAIRDGALTYDALLAEAERLGARMQAAAGHAALPPDVDYAALDALLFAVIRDHDAMPDAGDARTE